MLTLGEREAGTQERCVQASQFFCKSKTVPKTKVYLRKIGEKETYVPMKPSALPQYTHPL
jgi:hypothetical protein